MEIETTIGISDISDVHVQVYFIQVFTYNTHYNNGYDTMVYMHIYVYSNSTV